MIGSTSGSRLVMIGAGTIDGSGIIFRIQEQCQGCHLAFDAQQLGTGYCAKCIMAGLPEAHRQARANAKAAERQKAIDEYHGHVVKMTVRQFVAKLLEFDQDTEIVRYEYNDGDPYYDDEPAVEFEERVGPDSGKDPGWWQHPRVVIQ